MENHYTIPALLSCFNSFMDEMFLVTGITEGEKARLTRLARRLRLIDLASQSHVTVAEIISLEKGGYVRPLRKKQILVALGLLDDHPEPEHD